MAAKGANLRAIKINTKGLPLGFYA
jgi:hypothetical protein